MRDRLWLHIAGGITAAVILAPLAVPGYVLSYDMVFVPAQPMVLDLIAPVHSAPRAVPLDAAISLASFAVPGWLLQRAVLVAIIWAAVVGAGRLVPASSLSVRILAGVAYGWTPFLAERLLIGQWALLICYAALPFLVLACRDVLEHRPGGLPRLIIAAGLSALTPTGGIIAAVVCLALLARAGARRLLTVAGMLLLLNSPWIIAAAVSESHAVSDPAGVPAFAARAENWGGAVLSLLGTGGIWNSETTPASRGSFFAPILTLILLGLVLYGYPIMRRKLPIALTAVALAGLGVAVVSTFHSGQTVLAWLVTNVPGAGLLRDAQKFVLPYALLFALCLALGAQRLAGKLPAEPGKVLLAGVLLITVGGMPDLAYGGAGALRPVSYPEDWPAVARIVRADPGEVLSLPLSEYRSYAWNRDRTVIDPAPRYVDSPVLTDDTLIVGEHVIAGENERLNAIRTTIASGEPVAATGVRWILLQSPAPLNLTGLDLVYNGPHLKLYRNVNAPPSGGTSSRHWPIVAAEVAALLVLLTALVAAGSWRLRRWRQAH